MKERDLMNLCTYCQLIKSETSFHCLFCGRCTEMFDHHCPFINNCLGHRNYKYFLLFILSYFMFLALISGEVIRNFVETVLQTGYVNKDNVTSLILISLLGCCYPLILFQISAQCRTLCRKRKVSFVTQTIEQATSEKAASFMDSRSEMIAD